MEHFSVLYVGQEMPNDELGRYTVYVVDGSSYVSELPTTGPNGVNAQGPRPGSMAVAPNGDMWMLTNARTWAAFGEEAVGNG